jgi:SAM-dependent methyltransferase
MDVAYESKYHQLEADGWWFVARRERIAGIFKDIPRSASILDIGCSSGMLLGMLRDMGFTSMSGIDVSETGVELARRRGFSKCYVMDGTEPTFLPESFDAIISSDSIEHMEHDLTALRHWYRLLRPGGMLVVFAPAYKWLWSSHDVVNHHFRRYTRSELAEKTAVAGFNIARSGYWNSVLLPAVAVARKAKMLLKLDKETHTDLLRPLPGPINNTLKWLLRAENWLARRANPPFGVSAFIIAHKV